MRGGLGGNKEFEGAEIEARSAGSQWVSLIVEGTLGRNNALRLADAKQASALRVSVICYFILEPPCGSPRLAFATHSRSMPRQARAAAKSAASSSASTSSGNRAALPPRRAKPRQAGTADALQRRVHPAATARLPSRQTCWQYAPVHHSPPQPRAPDPRPARPAPLVPHPLGAAQPAAAPASQQALTAPNGIDRGGLAQVCLLPHNPSPLLATARDKLLLAHLPRQHHPALSAF